MRNFLIGWALNALTLYLVANILPGVDVAGDFGSVVLVALIIGLVNAILRPVLYLLSCGLIVVTLGLIIPVLNAILLLLADELAGDRFNIDGILWAIVCAVLMGIINSVLHNVFVSEDRKEKKRHVQQR